MKNEVPLYVDPLAAAVQNAVVGANAEGKHIVNVNIERDFQSTKLVDLTNAVGGDRCPHCKGTLKAKKGIEVGNTFMLGTKYAEALGAKFLDAEGKEQPIIMGSYGIGITRTPQAALEKRFDEKGIIWPKNISPYLVELIPLKMDSPEQAEAAESVYRDLQVAGIDVLMDDRDERPGVKFNDADLIGIPIRITIGAKSLADGKVELKQRSSREVALVPLDEVVDAVRKLVDQID